MLIQNQLSKIYKFPSVASKVTSIEKEKSALMGRTDPRYHFLQNHLRRQALPRISKSQDSDTEILPHRGLKFLKIATSPLQPLTQNMQKHTP